MKKVTLSVVSPVYKAEACIEELYKRLTATLSKITSSYEIILVEDRGADQSWDIVRSIAEKDTKVRAIRLSKNFGQHKAITAGLEHAQGEYIVIMDCDLQDSPEEITNLYNKILEGHDMVMGRRVDRQDKAIKRLLSSFFYKIYSFCTEVKIDPTIANFGIYSRRVIQSFLKLKEQHRFFPITIKWVGFDCATIEVKHLSRYQGKSSYTFYKLMRHAIDNIISNSSMPLLIICNVGLLLSLLSFVYGSYLSFRWLFWSISLQGWTSIMVFLNFIGGIIILSIGLLGLYIRKIFEEVKGRPLYVIDEQINVQPHK